MQRLINTRRCVCLAVPGEEHTRLCPYPDVVVERRPELWQIPESAPVHHLDELLELCTRRALRNWIQSGRTL